MSRSNAFNQSLEDYLEALTKEKKKVEFLRFCREIGTVNPTAINEFVQQQEDKHKLGGPLMKVLRRLADTLKDYSEVIGQLVSAQPLPCAIIWGTLKVAVEGAARCRDMFDTIKSQLNALADSIRHITDYEELYGNSDIMQKLLFRSYTNIIRFWHRVHKEYNRKSTSIFIHALTSSTTDKLTAIVKDLQHDEDCIVKEGTILQAKLNRDEVTRAHTERLVAAAERISQSQWRAKQNAHNYLDLCDKIRKYLTPELAHGENSKRHDMIKDHHQVGTCNWILEDEKFTAWKDPSSSAPPILCLSGPAGYGKSVLTSVAIHDIKRQASVAYYYCQFSQLNNSSYEVLRLLALQLFNNYFERKLPVDQDLCHQVLSSTTALDVKKLIREFIMCLAPAYFFFDGLDEVHGDSVRFVSTAIDFLAELCDEFVGQVRLWCSKRRQARAVDCYDVLIRPCPRPHAVLEITHHTEADVVRYLRSRFDALENRLEDEGLSAEDRDLLHSARDDLIKRAKGNFLWAWLMTEDFHGEDRVDNVQELRCRVDNNFPEELDNRFTSIFNRLIKPGDRAIASQVIALVAYARRHLRVAEIRDMAFVFQTRGKKNGNDDGLGKMHLNTFLSKYTALIEIDKDVEDIGSATCRLVHSSVLDFLERKPDVLGKDYPIRPYTIADACLIYLAQHAYGKPLRSPNTSADTAEWTDALGRSMDGQFFAQYAAKNWSRHLEDVNPVDDALRRRVDHFVTHPNFQTCMQMQSLWVEGKFALFGVQGRSQDDRGLLRTLPKWFIYPPSQHSHRSLISKQWNDYQLLLHDWRRFLDCYGCDDSENECECGSYRGEVDRIWYASLGPKHSFHNFYSRYTSFRLADCSGDERSLQEEQFAAIRIISEDKISTLRLKSWNHHARTLDFVCEHWCFMKPFTSPRLDKRQIIQTDEASSNWRLYAGKNVTSSLRLVARPTDISDNGATLRIGAQLFFLDNQGDYQPLMSTRMRDPTYFEEFSSRGPFLATGCRAYGASQHALDAESGATDFAQALVRMEEMSKGGDDMGSDSETNADINSGDWDESSELESDTEEEEAGHESWSEGSTDNDEELVSDPDDGIEEPTEFDCLGSSEDDKDTGSSNDSEDVDSDSDQSLPPEAFMTFTDEDGEHEEAQFTKSVDLRLGASQHGRSDIRHGKSDAAAKESSMLLEIFDTSGSNLAKVFSFVHPLAIMLYASPPSIHPFKSLVVWPLGGGEVLFADFILRTYFVRKLRASAIRTRSICVKVHFSPCGQYLHIASLEAQTDDPRAQKRKKKKNSGDPLCSLYLYLLLTTYRLSSKRTTRSPPTPMHRVKVALGGQEVLQVSRLPFTFAWTEENLFVTQSATKLTVVRVALFPRSASAGPKNNVLVPKGMIILPDTADHREVHSVPSKNGCYASVILGAETRASQIALIDPAESKNGELQLAFEMTEAETGDCTLMRGMLSPPIGCFLDEVKDIGGWARKEDIALPKSRGAGRLDRLKEKFDPEEDCDIVPYLRFV